MAFPIEGNYRIFIKSLSNLLKTVFFSSKCNFHQLKGGFPQQVPRPTCDCISDLRRISAVSWGHPAYIMRALPHVGLPISGRCAPSHHYGSWASELPSAARPLDLTLRAVRFPAPCTPHNQTTLISRIDARNPRSPGAL